MKPNVFFKVRERGKLIHCWEGHNVWTLVGREYLPQLSALATADPDTYVEDNRIKHLQFGIGGKGASLAIPAAVDTAYPAGNDPHTTNGREYNHEFHVNPEIGTLERPIRMTGGSAPYPGDPADVWLTPAAGFFVTRPTTYQTAFRYFLDLAGGEIVYAPFTSVPLSEMGLVTAAGDVSTAYNPVVAYVNFGEVALSASMELEVVWVVSF